MGEFVDWAKRCRFAPEICQQRSIPFSMCRRVVQNAGEEAHAQLEAYHLAMINIVQAIGEGVAIVWLCPILLYNTSKAQGVWTLYMYGQHMQHVGAIMVSCELNLQEETMCTRCGA